MNHVTPSARARRLGGVALALTTLATASCREAPDGVAGARVVLEVDTVFRVGSPDDPEYSFTYPTRVALTEAGDAFVLHPLEQVIRVFKADGTIERSVGRAGAGPGEFRQPRELGIVGDTLWVFDTEGDRFSVFRSDTGVFVRSFSVPREPGLGRDWVPEASAIRRDGRLQGVSYVLSHRIASGEVTHEFPLLLDSNGTVLDTLPGQPVGRNVWPIEHEDGPMLGGWYQRQPFADGPLWQWVPDQEALMVLLRPTPTGPDRGTLSLLKIAFHGDTLLRRDLSYVPAAVTDQMVDSILSQTIPERGIFGEPAVRVTEWARETLYQPEFRPGATRMVVGVDGSTWIRTPDVQEGQTEWIVVNPEGSVLGQVKLPSRFVLLAASLPLLWGVETDDLDVPFLMKLRVM